MLKSFRFEIEEFTKRNRLDAFLYEKVTAVSKIYLLNRLKENKCAVNGIVQPGGYHLQKGDVVEIEIDLDAATGMKPENIPLDVVYEDEEIIVINKPAGLLVHPTLGVKSGTLLNALSYYFNREYFRRLEEDTNLHAKSNIVYPFIRPGLIHRLDRQTSGLMVLSKTDRALRILNSHFQRKLVEKKYTALVEGVIETDSGTINAPIGHFEEQKKWGVKENGKSAETRFRVLERHRAATLLELEPITGRTHQLRIHCSFINHPIIGDDVHGGRASSRLCLHASYLKFWHPNGTGSMKFVCKVPLEAG